MLELSGIATTVGSVCVERYRQTIAEKLFWLLGGWPPNTPCPHYGCAGNIQWHPNCSITITGNYPGWRDFYGQTGWGADWRHYRDVGEWDRAEWNRDMEVGGAKGSRQAHEGVCAKGRTGSGREHPSWARKCASYHELNGVETPRCDARRNREWLPLIHSNKLFKFQGIASKNGWLTPAGGLWQSKAVCLPIPIGLLGDFLRSIRSMPPRKLCSIAMRTCWAARF